MYKPSVFPAKKLGLGETIGFRAQAKWGKKKRKEKRKQNAEVMSIINKDRQVAPKRMQLGARLAVNTHNVGGRFVESVKNARWSMSPHKAGDGLKSMVEFQVQIKEHNNRRRRRLQGQAEDSGPE